MSATHATRVVNLVPRIDRQAEANRLREELYSAIAVIHLAEHANIRMETCANPICVKYVALRRQGRVA